MLLWWCSDNLLYRTRPHSDREIPLGSALGPSWRGFRAGAHRRKATLQPGTALETILGHRPYITLLKASHSMFPSMERRFGKGMSTEKFTFQSLAVHWMALTSSPTSLSCRMPYKGNDSLNALPSFSEKALLFTDFCLVASPSSHSMFPSQPWEYLRRHRKPNLLYTPGIVAHVCGDHLSRYACRATRVAADILVF